MDYWIRLLSPEARPRAREEWGDPLCYCWSSIVSDYWHVLFGAPEREVLRDEYRIVVPWGRAKDHFHDRYDGFLRLLSDDIRVAQVQERVANQSEDWHTLRKSISYLNFWHYIDGLKLLAGAGAGVGDRWDRFSDDAWLVLDCHELHSEYGGLPDDPEARRRFAETLEEGRVINDALGWLRNLDMRSLSQEQAIIDCWEDDGRILRWLFLHKDSGIPWEAFEYYLDEKVRERWERFFEVYNRVEA